MLTRGNEMSEISNRCYAFYYNILLFYKLYASTVVLFNSQRIKIIIIYTFLLVEV